MKQNPYDSFSRIIPALAISGIGALFYNILPVYVGAAQDSLALSSSSVGLLTAAFFAGYNLVTASAFFWIRTWNWQSATLFWFPTALIAISATLLSPSYPLLLASTCVAGGGFAALYGIGTTILADTSNPARWYGIKIAVETVPGAILLFLLPGTLIAQFGLKGVVYGIVGASILLATGLFTLPRSGKIEAFDETAEEPQRSPGASPYAVWLALMATLLFFSAASGMWAFIERLGVSLLFDPETIGLLLAVTLVFATAGSLTTAWLGARFGNVKPFLGCAGSFLLALIGLSQATDFPLYAAATSVLTFAIGMGLPFAIAEVAALDRDGRYIVLSVPAIGLGAMIGPASAGVLTDGGSFLPLMVAAGAALALSCLAILSSQRGSRGV